MRDLYGTIGTLAAVAHGNGDDIDENTYPSDQNNDRHGLDIFSGGQYIRLRAVPNEPRFTIECPYTLVSRLRQQYTTEELSDRADVEFTTLSDDGRERVMENVLRSDLEAAEQYEDEFSAAVSRELGAETPDIIRLEYSEEGLWNGVMIRDRIFPSREAFDITDYRRAVNRMLRVKKTVAGLVTQEVESLTDNRPEASLSATETKANTDLVGFQ